MIRVKNLTKTFTSPRRGTIGAVSGVTFTVRKREVFGLLGPNGAGKTTLLRMLATILTPSSGTGELNQLDLVRDRDRIKRSIGFLSGNTRPYGRLTPRELLHYFGTLYDMEQNLIEDRIRSLADMLDMGDSMDQRIDRLSSGQVQKTSIARCILHDPPILILDEPTLGLDILTSRTIICFIRDAAKRGHTVLFSTHYMEEAELLCNRIGLLHRGSLLDIDSLDGLRHKSGRHHLSDIFLHYIKQTGNAAS